MRSRVLGTALLGALALAGQAPAAERIASFPVNGRAPVAGPIPLGGEVVQRFSGRDRTGELVVAERRRSLRPAG